MGERCHGHPSRRNARYPPRPVADTQGRGFAVAPPVNPPPPLGDIGKGSDAARPPLGLRDEWSQRGMRGVLGAGELPELGVDGRCIQ